MPRRRREIERRLTRRVELTYLQSIQIQEGDRAPEDFFEVGSDFSPLDQITPKRKRAQQRLADIINTKFSYSGDPQLRREEDTGWVLTDTYEEVDWSKIAYRIGIREVGLNSFVYAPVSSRVSVPIKSPKPIWKMILKANEDIPPSFNPNFAWIHYEVTIDEGQTWYRLNPVGKPTRFDDNGEVVPRVITVNSEISSPDPETRDLTSDNDVKSVRLRYTLFTDPDLLEPETSSPVLKGVQLLLYPRGGLSDSRPEQVS